MARPPSALQFARTRLLVSDFPRSWRFYRDVLGLTPVKGHGEPPYGEFLAKGGAMVSLFDRGEMAAAVGLSAKLPPKRSLGRSAIIFETEDVDATAARLRRRRVLLLRGPTNRPGWGLRTIYLLDPDGYLIEIYSRPK